MPRKVRISLKAVKGSEFQDEKDFNIKLVKEVERYPCLYDTSLSEYYNRDVLEKTWEEVGSALNQNGKHNQINFNTFYGDIDDSVEFFLRYVQFFKYQ